ncbi:GPW/gp25 family protein [Pectobacterium carotovorum]|uniref:Baseplate assembly protein n=1 Tax=Pectobacterium parvum TaxID=2778550 RepID=A0AAP9IMQ6_9GAMM|nr:MULTISPECIES: GPW/gp25 family protein [Pectobacterium]MCA6969241.1 GPW/gp25 family protein [Pectobacterium carotovorum]POE18446.1 baseplate assembly protein [Pectobacterium odoriferum]QHQ26379.1 baseplate assembly protein [Pectobacterium parvum]TAI96501.1 baseplate assembly protein [Pectobacterium versatile]UEQ07703.1 GPW/gp25 family protein [Pectobacterium versatile]
MSNEKYIGMNARNGRAITDDEHISQSVRDILLTPVGSRLMRRSYGSQLFSLIDEPQEPAIKLKITSAIYSALMRWEPRITPTKITLETRGAGLVAVTLQAQRTDNLAEFNTMISLQGA